MKITSIELLPASKYLFIKLYTDEGIYGTGEVGAWGYLDGCTGILKKMEGYLIGQDPFRIEHHWNYLYRSMYFRGSILMSALSAIDIALWDIKGKALGVPVYELLGGKCRDKVRSYEAVFKFTPEEIAQRCVELKEMGFDAARLMITGDIRLKQAKRRSSVYNAKVSDYIKVVKAVREAVGDEFDMILECHRSMDPMEAIAFAKGVEEYRPLFLEDPIPPDSPESMADIAMRTNIPIATGERFINIQEFETTFQKHAAKYVRPDVCALGGLTPSKKVAAMAANLEGDEKTGANIILKALEAPLTTIAYNAGLEGAVIINKVRESDEGVGFNALTEEYVDMVKAGIVDPANVTRSALQNATSVASTLLTTESVVSTIKEDVPAMPAGGAGGMGMM